MTETVKVVFFDVGGTLLSPDPSLAEIYRRVLTPLGIECEVPAFRRAALETWAELDAVVGRGRNRYAHFAGGERAYWRAYVGRVLDRLSAGHLADEATAALYAAFSDPSAWAVFPETRGTLRALRERGFRLAVISNWDSRLRTLLANLGLAPEFEEIVVSSEVGVEKPEPRIFETALDLMGVAPDEALHVGDDLVLDYEGARALGMEAALLARRGDAPPHARSVAALDGLLPLLGNGA